MRLALGILDAENQHVLGHPSLSLGKVGADAQRVAFFAHKSVAAVAGVNRPDGVILRKMADIALFGIERRLGMQAADPVVGIAQLAQRAVARAGHDQHGQRNVNGIRDLNADSGGGGTKRPHYEGNDVHGAALHTAVVDLAQHGVGLFRVHPVVGGARVLLAAAADKGAVLHTRNVEGIGAMQYAAGQLFLIEQVQLARGKRLSAQNVGLLVAAVEPENLVRLAQGDGFVHPRQHGRIGCIHVKSPSCILKHSVRRGKRPRPVPPAFGYYSTALPQKKSV